MRAAQYVRMSTEHQQYSIGNQQTAIARYAERHGFEIVQTYSDQARSGIDLAHRPGLRQLLQDVVTAQGDYQAILVFDVSRWGRFQDTDESAYYEFFCKRAGVRVHYCAESFSNDDTLASTLLKTVKRAMAGEYLRELSAKVSAGQCRIAMSGFKMNGRAGYGLRRYLLDQNGHPKCPLADGEWKSVQSDRVVYVAGPSEEVSIVQEIYSLFLRGSSINAIVRSLAERKIPRDRPGEWNYYAVYKILTHPKYTGSIVFGQTSCKLKGKTKHIPRGQWLVRTGAFAPLVSQQTFDQVQKRLRGRMAARSNEEVLTDLSLLLEQRGEMNLRVIEGNRSVVSAVTIRKRFGGMLKLYELLARQHKGDSAFINVFWRTKHIRRAAVEELIAACEAVAIRATETGRRLALDGYGEVRLEVAMFTRVLSGEARWQVSVWGDNAAVPVVLVRLREGNVEILDLVFFVDAPVRKAAFRVSNDMLKDCPKGIAPDIVAAIVSQKGQTSLF